MYSVKENLEELMSNHNLTLTQLSAELGIPYKTISNYTNGKYLPNLNTAIKLLTIFIVALIILLVYLTVRNMAITLMWIIYFYLDMKNFLKQQKSLIIG